MPEGETEIETGKIGLPSDKLFHREKIDVTISRDATHQKGGRRSLITVEEGSPAAAEEKTEEEKRTKRVIRRQTKIRRGRGLRRRLSLTKQPI